MVGAREGGEKKEKMKRRLPPVVDSGVRAGSQNTRTPRGK